MLRPHAGQTQLPNEITKEMVQRMDLAIFTIRETTGLPDFKAPSGAPHQPHIVQLAALLVDLDTRQTSAAWTSSFRPNGWTIPADICHRAWHHDRACQSGRDQKKPLSICSWRCGPVLVG